MKNQKGFSLIELLIVVVIIGIIAAIAIPNLLAARRSANEGSAMSAMRNLHSSQTTYQATSGNGDYSPDLTTLGPAGAGLIDRTLADAADGSTNDKSGFVFVSEGSIDGTTGLPVFFNAAYPTTSTTTSSITGTGTRRFTMSQVGAIYADAVDKDTRVDQSVVDGLDLNGPSGDWKQLD